MKKQISITDLTRMQRGRVCIAGYDEKGICYRPTLPPPGISEQSLFLNGKPVISPFAIVEFSFIAPRPQPPHTEDFDYDPRSMRFIRRIDESGRQQLLELSLFDNIESIFEQKIHDDFGYYVMDCVGPRSIGTIVPRKIIEIKYETDVTGNWDYRVRFIDRSGINFRLKITDLTWHYYCDSLRDENHQPAEISRVLSQKIQTKKVFLRIGLSRGWEKFPDRCYLQVNAIHTFPDYLKGKTFADFSSYKSIS